MSAARPTFTSARPHLAALGGYLALTLIMTYPLAVHFTSSIPGDGFDGWQNYWNLWWVKTALLDLHQSPYFTDFLYHPTGYSLLFQTLNIFNSFLTLPIQLAFGVTVSYNFVVLFSFVVGGYGAYLLTLHLLGTDRSASDQLTAFFAGAVFAFSPFHFAHLLGHMQVFSIEWLPFFVLCLVRSLSSSQLRVGRHIGLPVVFLVLAALCDWYFALYLLIFMVLYLGYRLWVDRRPRLPLLKTGMVLALSGVLLSPLLVPMLVEALRDSAYLRSPFETTVRLSADLLAFLTPNEFHPVWGQAATRVSQVFTSSTSERVVFAGYIPLLLAGYAVWRRRREAAFWLVCCLVFLTLALGPYLHVAGRQLPIPLPYLGLYHLVPFFSIARSVSRFNVMVSLGLAVLAALGLQEALRRVPADRGRGVALLAVALVCFEFLPVPYPLSRVEIPSFYESVAADDTEYAILELPMNWDRPAHLLYQTVHRKPIMAGYVTRPNPLSLVERVPVLQQFRFLGPDIIAQDPKEVAPEVFDHLGVRYAILHHYMLPPGSEREATMALVDEVFGGQSPLYEDGQITVYLAGGQGRDSPFLMLGPEWGERQVRDGTPMRAQGREASVTVVAPSAGDAHLIVSAFSEEGSRTLELSLNGAAVAALEIEPVIANFEIGHLSLTEGTNTLRFEDVSEGEPTIFFTSLDLKRVG